MKKLPISFFFVEDGICDTYTYMSIYTRVFLQLSVVEHMFHMCDTYKYMSIFFNRVYLHLYE